jgi:DNA-binding response OmpR family regulator
MFMQKILVIDDDLSIRNLLKMRLSDEFEVIDTGDPEQALGLALHHKPDAIFMDLMMPKFSGFELCQSLRTLSYTSRIPIFVITGEAGDKFREHCQQLGATAYFEKPIDFKKLRESLKTELQGSRVERRAHVRVRMRIPLKLRGLDGNGQHFEENTTTENVSAAGFLCSSGASLVKDGVVEVSLAGDIERYVGKARVTRKEASGAPWQRYGFHFIEKNTEWVLQEG